MNSLNNLVNFYKKNLGFECFYKILMDRKKDSNYSNEYTNSDNFLKDFTKLSNKVKLEFKNLLFNSIIGNNKINVRVDIPVWFGNYKKNRIIVYGLEPRDTNKALNIEEKLYNNVKFIYATPFGCDRWNVQPKGKIPKVKQKIKGAPHHKYFTAFKEIIQNENIFVIFSDIVKYYEVIGQSRNANDKIARKYFRKKALQHENIKLIKNEIKIIKPHKILLLGREAEKVFKNCIYKYVKEECDKTCHIEYLRHPSYGGIYIAKEKLKNIIENNFKIIV